MALYTMKDFKKGDSVYHLSNTKHLMVAIELNEDQNEISCRWIDKNGTSKIEQFMPEELGKDDDLQPKISYSINLP